MRGFDPPRSKRGIKATLKCVKCGVEVSGVVAPDGKLYASDYPENGGKPAPGICVSCEPQDD